MSTRVRWSIVIMLTVTTLVCVTRHLNTAQAKPPHSMHALPSGSGECQEDIDCGDEDPCTSDICFVSTISDIEPPGGSSGICVHRNNGACDEQGACCLDDGAQCIEATELCCKDVGGTYQGDGSLCLGDVNLNNVDDACERCGTGLCGDGVGGVMGMGMFPFMLLGLGVMKLRLSRTRRRE